MGSAHEWYCTREKAQTKLHSDKERRTDIQIDKNARSLAERTNERSGDQNMAKEGARGTKNPAERGVRWYSLVCNS